jgi:ERCC4-related helicase
MESKIKLKSFQKKAIEEVVKGRDVFVCLPTGSGKTFCFAFLPELFQSKGNINLRASFPRVDKSTLHFSSFALVAKHCLVRRKQGLQK